MEVTREKFLLEIAQKRNSWRILKEPEVIPYPIKPSFSRNIIISLLGGLFLGTILALIRDSKDNVFHSSKEIEEETELTLLGEIPYTGIFDNLKTKKDLSDWFISLNDNNEINQENQKNYKGFFTRII